MRKKKVVCLLVCPIVFALGFCASTRAQTVSASVTGLVLDPNAAAIVEANVTAKNVDTGIETIVQTNSEGLYHFANLEPGNYEFSVSKRGFKVIVKPAVNLHVADTISMNFNMQVGDLKETVTVEGGAPLINTETAAVSTVIDRNFVENLPLNGRSFNTLLQLTPGVVIAAVGPGQVGQFSIAGQRTDANNFTVDGVSANFGVGGGQNLGESGTGGAQAFSAVGGTSSLVSVDALQEFRIETSSFAPEFGRTPGGQVILSTRSGTNALHGAIFDYFRNTAMDANDWFANAAGKPRAPEHHNDFGGVLGGPISKDKTFFFISYEGARLDLPQTAVTQVPSACARASSAACPSGNQSASVAIAPYLNAFPQPNGPAPSNPCASQTPDGCVQAFTGSWPNRATLDAGSVRIDHTFNQRFSVFGRYNYAPSQIQQRQQNFSLSNLSTTSVDTETLTLGVNMSLSSQRSNILRGNYSTQNSDQSFALDSFGGAVPLNSGLLLGTLPAARNAGFFLTFDTLTPFVVGPQSKGRTRQINITDYLAMGVGSHQLKFGGDYRLIFLDVDNVQNEVFYFASSVQSLVSTGSADFISASTAVPSNFLIHALSLYGQDTWRVSPRLALTYGLRWELNPAPSPRDNTKLAAWKNTNNPAAITLAPFGTALWGTTYGNLAPRLGLAWNVTPAGNFVLRAGAGIFYDLGAGTSAQLANDFPNLFFNFSPGASLPVGDVTPFLPTISLQPPFASGNQGFSSNLKLPRAYEWNVALEKSFAGKQVLTATYVGQAGRKLLRQEALFQPNANFAGDFLLTVNDARSNYNALQLQFRRPLASRLQALLNYTWSHSLDNASNDVVSGFSNTVISAANDYASSTFDVRHSFSGALSYDVPSAAKSSALAILTRGWSLQTVIVSRSGFPFNAEVLSVSPDPGGFAFSRPDLVPGQPLWIPNPAAPGGKSLNPGAFAVPSTVRQGTEGRNNIAGFGLSQVDLSFGRKFMSTERMNFQFRADAFNVMNHPNFANPLGAFEFGAPFLRSQFMVNQVLGGLNPLFQEGGPRSLQLSLKMSF